MVGQEKEAGEQQAEAVLEAHIPQRHTSHRGTPNQGLLIQTTGLSDWIHQINPFIYQIDIYKPPPPYMNKVTAYVHANRPS